LSRSIRSSAIFSPRAASKMLNRHSREGGNPGRQPRRSLLDPRFRCCDPIGVDECASDFDIRLSRHPGAGRDPSFRKYPIFERFLRPCLFGKRHAGWEMGPGLRRDDVICSEGAMIIHWITADYGLFRGGDERGLAIVVRNKCFRPGPPSPPSGLRAGFFQVGDVAGRSHVAQSRPSRHRECSDCGFVFGNLRHDRFLGAVEDAAISGDEVL